uniref:MYCL proto-onco, bHLH transcription factor n=1 Tax=Pseudonaja textilis TaxID=8673 RepID=A0A670ZXE4_PSETE
VPERRARPRRRLPAMELDPPLLPPPPPSSFYEPWEAQGEDIWKKFELLPSPPASPLPGPAEDADGAPEPAAGLLGNLSAFVLRDCMWSGSSARERLEKARGEKLAAKPAPALAPAHDFGGLDGDREGAGGSPPAPRCSPLAALEPPREFRLPRRSLPGPLRASLAAPANFPGLLAGSSLSRCPGSSGSSAGSPGSFQLIGCLPLPESQKWTLIPVDSSLFSLFAEGEEIDVVTVEKRQASRTRKPVTITVRGNPLDPCTKHFHIAIHQQQHNYAARSPPEARSVEGPLEKVSPDARDDEPQPPGQGVGRFPPVPSLPKTGSAPGSDSEDVTKRRNHNYLERKRRNDLRSRFLALRDQVPGLASCPKTPKVVVLSKASEYLQLLLSAEQQMVAEKKLLKLHQLQLQQQISHLQGTQ